MRLAIIGDGRMGRAVAGLAEERGFEVVALIGVEGNAHGAGITGERLAAAEVAVEFTEPAAAADNALACIAAGVPVVVGTTGWYDRLPQVEAAVAEGDGALLWAPNFSVGVVLFRALLERAGALFAGAGFGASIVETHHAAKKDAPSGTALSLGRVFGAAAGAEPEITSIRLGHVPGTHALVLDGPFEQIRLEHEARDRRVFADGALRAAAWLRGRRGVFTMNDVLGIRTEGEA
ncbi:MAG: dihydrodipicolinate reductase C-terminal domain-containing protein [Gemmatimonadota bacterium]|jgi:4-hydroxy-tetrahydrodipicolinate reductase